MSSNIHQDKDVDAAKTILDASLKKLLSFIAAGLTSFLLQISILLTYCSSLVNMQGSQLQLLLSIILGVLALISCVGSILFMTGVSAELITINHFTNILGLRNHIDKINFPWFSKFYRHFTPDEELSILEYFVMIAIGATSVLMCVFTVLRILSFYWIL